MQIQIFNFAVDLLQAILWQYDRAISIQSLLTSKQDWYDDNQTDFWFDWYRLVFNLTTANEFGCTVWSLILNLPLFVPPGPQPDNIPIWGFGQYRKNFNRGVFTNDPFNPDELTLEERRLLLLMRCFKLISRCAILEINQFLKFLFNKDGTKNTYLLDGLDMTITLIFNWPVNPNIVKNIIKYDLIPRGTGVKLKVKVDPTVAFGFGPFHKNFNRGTFAQDFNDG